MKMPTALHHLKDPGNGIISPISTPQQPSAGLRPWKTLPAWPLKTASPPEWCTLFRSVASWMFLYASCPSSLSVHPACLASLSVHATYLFVCGKLMHVFLEHAFVYYAGWLHVSSLCLSIPGLSACLSVLLAYLSVLSLITLATGSFSFDQSLSVCESTVILSASSICVCLSQSLLASLVLRFCVCVFFSFLPLLSLSCICICVLSLSWCLCI